MSLRLDSTTTHKLGALAARYAPRSVSHLAVTVGATMASLFAGDRRVIVERNIERAIGRPLKATERRQVVAKTFTAYGRYYLDSFRLPSLDAETIDDGFQYNGFQHITNALDAGNGCVLVLPHLGGWEWAAFWLTKIHGFSVTAVVEPLEPPELFEWFKSFRESLGMDVVSVGPDAGPAILDALAKNSVVCLLSDRIVADAVGVPVDFFGERTLLPAGPAMVGLRTGVPILPVAVYFDGDRHFAEVRPSVSLVREGKFREDVQRVTQDLANELERFVRKAPEQWHVLQPGWPSDFRALGRPIPEKLRSLQ